MMFALRANDVACGNDDASLMMCAFGTWRANIASWIAQRSASFRSVSEETSSAAAGSDIIDFFSYLHYARRTQRAFWENYYERKQTCGIIHEILRPNHQPCKHCGGTGLATNSTYSGFYYSADDTPFALEFPSNELTEISPGVFEWKSSTGEAITTERIMPNWFYYNMEWY